MRKLLAAILLLLLMGVVLPASARQASGTPQKPDESRTTGDYDITIGWRIEPAYVGVFNGPEFWIKTHADGKPVTGAEQTLHMLVHFGDQQRLLQFYPLDDGHYTADLIPTRPGDYTFHLFGQINGQDVDELFTSADGYFDSVDPETDVQFPPLNATPVPEASAAATVEAGSTESVNPAATPEVTAEATQTIASVQAEIDELRQQLQQLQAGKSS